MGVYVARIILVGFIGRERDVIDFRVLGLAFFKEIWHMTSRNVITIEETLCFVKILRVLKSNIEIASKSVARGSAKDIDRNIHQIEEDQFRNLLG